MFRLTALGIIALTALTPYANADADEAKKLFQRMSEAAKTLNYEGVFVYHQGRRMDTMKIVHVHNSSDGEIEELTSLNGASWKVIRKGNEVYCPFPEQKGEGLKRSRIRNFSALQARDSIGNLSDFYDFSVMGEERVAGRACRVLWIKPKDNYRYGYKLWIDSEHGLLMRTDVLDQDRQIVEQMMFTQVKYFEKPPKVNFRSVDAVPSFPVLNRPGPGPKQVSWQAQLPPGFYLAEHQRRVTDKANFEHMVYTDGLASISVFIERKPSIKASKDTITHGAVNAIALNNGKFNRMITVVGEVPKITVKQIATTIQHIPGYD